MRLWFHMPTTKETKSFWNANPLCAASIPFHQGTPEYFQYFNKIREVLEPLEFLYKLHEFEHFKNLRVLDVGCGNGYIISHYADEGANTIGIDFTNVGIRLSRRRFEINKLQGNFCMADGQSLPFKNNSFDCVCCMGVLHHMLNPKEAAREIHRVLKPGGLFISMVYHEGSAHYRLRLPLMSLYRRKSLRQLVNEVDGIGNPKGDVYSRGQLKKLLKDFTIESMFSACLQGEMVLPKYGKHIPDKILRPLEKYWGWNLYAKARKLG